MIQTKIKTKNNISLQIGRRIVFLYANDIDVNKELKIGDIGTITDLSLLPKGKKRMISIDWDNNSSVAPTEGRDQYEVLDD